MRKHGWQLPYHPLQVVAVAVFLGLGFAFCVLCTFCGEGIVSIHSDGNLLSSYPGVFKSKKYLKILKKNKDIQLKDSKLGGESASSIPDANAVAVGENYDKKSKDAYSVADPTAEMEKEASSSPETACFTGLLALLPCAFISNCSRSEESPEEQMSEDGMFYCTLCEVEVYKYSKHCRVCDKCVDCFDHHCRWLNNCVGKRNYRKFFILMVSSLLLLILQWSTGIYVLICCFLERKRFSADISSKLGSSFTVVPFAVVLAVFTILAMIATLQLAQLFFFHVLLIKKGISTYDYIMALREQEQHGIGIQQSPQMSPVSSLTGVSSVSSFNTFQRAAWCTPPRLFLEDQYDVVPPETGSVSSLGKKSVVELSMKKKNPAAVKISPWTLARLNAEEVSNAAAEARKKSKIMQPVVKKQAPYPIETDGSFGRSGRQMTTGPDNSRKRPANRIRLPADLPFEPMTKTSSEAALNSRGHLVTRASSSFLPLQLEARSIFHSSKAMSSSAGIVASSPESSLESPDIHPFRVSSSGAEEARESVGLSAANLAPLPLSRSTSDGYDASGGEDSDRAPTRIVQRSTNWNSLLFGSDYNGRPTKLKA